MIRFENIEVTFGDFTAIPGLDLEVKPGEFFTLPKVPPGRHVLRFIPRPREPRPVKPASLTINVSRKGLGPTDRFIVWFPTEPAT